MVSPRPDSPTRTPWPRTPTSTLGEEIDHLRLYGWPKQDIARHLRCTVSAVDKRIARQPEPVESWQVPA